MFAASQQAGGERQYAQETSVGSCDASTCFADRNVVQFLVVWCAGGTGCCVRLIDFVIILLALGGICARQCPVKPGFLGSGSPIALACAVTRHRSLDTHVMVHSF